MKCTFWAWKNCETIIRDRNHYSVALKMATKTQIDKTKQKMISIANLMILIGALRLCLSKHRPKIEKEIYLFSFVSTNRRVCVNRQFVCIRLFQHFVLVDTFFMVTLFGFCFDKYFFAWRMKTTINEIVDFVKKTMHEQKKREKGSETKGENRQRFEWVERQNSALLWFIIIAIHFDEFHIVRNGFFVYFNVDHENPRTDFTLMTSNEMKKQREHNSSDGMRNKSTEK